MSDRTIIIGDLHGCLTEAEKLLDECEATINDRIIFLGDLVDRGPNSAGCVDLAMRIEARQGQPACVLGNHEEKMLFYQDIEHRKGFVSVQIESHVETRKQLTQRHYDYFRRLPKFIRLPEHNAVCVHAGVWPGRPIEKQTDAHLLHVQAIKPYDELGNPVMGKNAERSIWLKDVPNDDGGWKFWTHFWRGPERVIFGHSVLNKPLVTEWAIGIDGGGCFGRELWALILPTMEIVRRQCHVNNKYANTNNRQLHVIDGDIGTY